MRPRNFRVVIPSRRRPHVVARRSLQLFPSATLCVAREEKDDYASACPGIPIVTHPNNVVGIGPLRRWILEHFDEEAIVMVDDEMEKLYCLVGTFGHTIETPSNCLSVAMTTAQCAKDAGAVIFGFNQAWDVRKFRPHKPFLLNSWAGNVIGWIGREILPDPNLRLRSDIDSCLQAMLKKRIVWIDARYSWSASQRFKMVGGNSVVRSAERNRWELDYLKRKWGEYIGVLEKKTAVRLIVRVARTWPLEIV